MITNLLVLQGVGDSEDSYAYDGGRICKWNVEGKGASSKHLLKNGEVADGKWVCRVGGHVLEGVGFRLGNVYGNVCAVR